MASQLERLVRVEETIVVIKDWISGQVARENKADERKQHYTRLVVGTILVFLINNALGGFFWLLGMGVIVALNAQTINAYLSSFSK